MRIVHTSDWHAGRTWRGIQRLDELAAVLDHLARFVAAEKVDLLLVSGDVFDTGAPIADAEDAVFAFLRRVGDHGVQSVVIAGNHDNPSRFTAWGRFASLARVHVVARPARADEGGVLRLRTAAGETAIVAALPFPRMADLVRAADIAAGDTAAHQTYADGTRRMVEHLCSSFAAGAVNLLVAHLHLQAAVLAGSERKVHVGEQWATTPQALPPHAHYVALGHIHRPQAVAAPSPAEYAGSPLQLDFGEEGDRKSFVVVDAAPGKPARVTRIPYEGGKEIRTVTAPLAELEARASELRAAGWLRVRVPLPQRDPELAAKVRRMLANAVAIEALLPERTEAREEPARPPAGASPHELFAAYYAARHQRPPEPAVRDAFAALYAAHDDATAP